MAFSGWSIVCAGRDFGPCDGGQQLTGCGRILWTSGGAAVPEQVAPLGAGDRSLAFCETPLGRRCVSCDGFCAMSRLRRAGAVAVCVLRCRVGRRETFMLHAAAGAAWVWTGHTSVCLPCKTLLSRFLSLCSELYSSLTTLIPHSLTPPMSATWPSVQPRDGPTCTAWASVWPFT